MDAYHIGFDDGHLMGENENPYKKEFTEFEMWLAYEDGFKDGVALFMAEESTPLDEQLVMSEV